MEKIRTLVAIPVFNESDVCDIVQRIKKYPVDILVVDDGSTNGLSNDIANIGNIKLLKHSMNMGYGKTIIDAFDFAINKEYDYLITIDGDGQHEPEEIASFLQEIPFYHYDIISGSRYLRPKVTNRVVPEDRYRINMEITRMINEITGYRLTDAFCGFKSYKVEKLKNLHLDEHGYGLPLQVWLQAWKMGLRVKEIPVELIYKDLSKRFQGNLKDPHTRIRYYKKIIENQLAGVR